MDDKEWAAGLELALNGTLSGSHTFLPGVWAMLRNLSQCLPVNITIAAGSESGYDERNALIQVTVSLD